ncbi:c-type cytochrome [Actibacterium pelagium]|nr:c-type cytochrome [Actibacterium pelagium]
MRGAVAHIFALTIWAATPLAAQEFTTLKGHGGPVMGIAVSPEGQVATASFDNSVGLWAGREPKWLDAHEAAVVDVTFGPNGPVSSGDDFTIYAWADDEAKKIGTHKGKVADVEVSPDGSLVASASWDGTVGFWTFDGTGETRKIPAGSVSDVVFSPDGELLYAAGSAGVIVELPVGEGDPRVIVKHGFAVNVLTIAPDGSWLAYGAVDGGTRVVDPRTGEQIADFSLDRRPILSIEHHPETHTLAVGDGHGFIMVIDTETWKITRDFQATRRGPIWALAFDPSGEVIYAGGIDDVVYSWPIAFLDEYDAIDNPERSFLRAPEEMANGERQFMRKCSICHALEDGVSRKAGPTLHGVFGRAAGTVDGYRYSDILDGSDIIWNSETIDKLFDLGPDHYIPGSKMPMQRITGPQDRADLIEFLKTATK